MVAVGHVIVTWSGGQWPHPFSFPQDGEQDETDVERDLFRKDKGCSQRPQVGGRSLTFVPTTCRVCMQYFAVTIIWSVFVAEVIVMLCFLHLFSKCASPLQTHVECLCQTCNNNNDKNNTTAPRTAQRMSLYKLFVTEVCSTHLSFSSFSSFSLSSLSLSSPTAGL